VSIVHEGRIVFNGGMPAEWAHLKSLLDRYCHCEIHAVYEAGYFGYWLHDYLREYGASCIVTPPSLIPRASGNRVKTDRIDSASLAEKLSKADLKAVTVPTKEERGHREVIRRRNQLIRDRVAVQLRIKAELRQYNIPFPEIRGRWTKQFVERLHCLDFKDRWLSESFGLLLEQLNHLNSLIERQTKLIHELAKLDTYRERVRILKTIPGIGTLIAMEILVELLDVRRFEKAKCLAAYIGLTPSQYSSGQHVRMGRITRSGKSHLRGLLVEAAWILIAKDPAIGTKYKALKHSGVGHKKAIVAIARKLAIRVRRVLLDGTPYVIGKAA
jgi:transposase